MDTGINLCSSRMKKKKKKKLGYKTDVGYIFAATRHLEAAINLLQLAPKIVTTYPEVTTTLFGILPNVVINSYAGLNIKVRILLLCISIPID